MSPPCRGEDRAPRGGSDRRVGFRPELPPRELPPRSRCPTGMASQLKQYAADHRYLLDTAGRAAGFAEPVAVQLDAFYEPLVKAARRGELLPLDGVLVRDW